MRPVCALAILLIPISPLWGQGPVQNRAADVFFGPDVFDARAVWVNPAALGIVPSASVMADITTFLPFENGSRVSQWTLGLSSRGFSFGYQHDEFGSGRARDTYRLGFGGGIPPLMIGGAVTFHRGIGKAVTGDIGAVYQATPVVALSGVLANIGQPNLGANDEFKLPATLIPSATLSLAGGRASLAAGAAFSSDSVHFVGGGLRIQPILKIPLIASARFDAINGKLDRGRLTLALSWGTQGVIHAALTSPDDFNRVSLLSITGVAVQPIGRPSRR